VFKFIIALKNNKSVLTDILNMLVHNTVVNSKVHFIELVKLLSKFNKKLCALLEIKEKEAKELEKDKEKDKDKDKDKDKEKDNLKSVENLHNKNKVVAIIEVKAAHSLCDCLS